MNKQQLLESSRTNWTVAKKPLFGPDGETTPAYGVFREDNNNCLGVVGSKYVPTQNEEILDMLLEAAARVNISGERGGFLGNGQKVYYQFPLTDVQIGGSFNKRFLTALTSHDGSAPMGFGTTNVTVVCSNTFYMALRDSQRVRHTKNSHERLGLIISQLQNSLTQEEQFIEKLVELSKIYIPEAVTDEFIINIIGGDGEASRGKNRINDFRTALTTEYETHENTAYALFNATTRFTNYMMGHKSIEAKRESLIHGTAYNINNRGLELISETYTPLYTPELSL
jgi:phage/plasmid-like protein (TIGR03299 family)